MTREPESKGFLGKAGFEKRDPGERLGFFVNRKVETYAIKFMMRIHETLSKYLFNLSTVISSF